MKKAVAITAIIMSALGLWFGYHLGYRDGETKGFIDGEWNAMNRKSDAPAPKKHHQYSFKQNGQPFFASILKQGKRVGYSYPWPTKTATCPRANGLIAFVVMTSDQTKD
jgi:hypothetical protein